MPYVKKNSRKRSRKMGRRVRRNYRKKRMTMYKTPRMGVGFPSSTFVKLKYVKQFSEATGASPYTLWFRGNGCFDPEYAIGGHQPMYFDNYMLIYKSYLAYASSLKLSIVNASGVAALQCIVWPSEDAGIILGDTSQVLEQTRASAAVTIPIAQQYTSIIKRFAKTSNVLGLSKAQLGDRDLAGTDAANPAKEWFWTVFLESSDSSTPVTASILVEIKYYVKFYDRLFEPQS